MQGCWVEGTWVTGSQKPYPALCERGNRTHLLLGPPMTSWNKFSTERSSVKARKRVRSSRSRLTHES